MEKIPTAEEILNDKVYITKDGIEDVHDSLSTVADVMIEFAKLHVEAALKEASEKATMIKIDEADIGDITVYIKDVDRKAILNIYPITNIK